MSKGRAIAAGVAGVVAAVAVAMPYIGEFEGYVPIGYPDPAHGTALPTGCFGSTRGIVLGKRYTDDQCAAMLAEDALRHGLEISHCLPAELPLETRAAFTSFAFNVGSPKFCGSTLARKARAGDLAGACAELSRWTYAGGKQLRGLVRRRAEERRLCESGL